MNLIIDLIIYCFPSSHLRDKKKQNRKNSCGEEVKINEETTDINSK